MMKTRFLFPYWCRYLGYGLFLIHIPIVLLKKQLGFENAPDTDTQALFNSHHLFFIGTTLLMALGLFLVAFARERMEDEQIWQIRLDSLRWAIYINYLILIVSMIFINDTQHLLHLNLWVPLIFFILRFRWVIFRLNRSLTTEG